MTDKELNEQIARLMGWVCNEHGIWNHDKRPGGWHALPDYLDPKRLGELAKLAEDISGDWTLANHTAFLRKMNGDPKYTYSASLCRDKLHSGSTPPLALARAIVAHIEHETTGKVVEALKEVAQEPLEPPTGPLGVNTAGWNSCPHCGHNAGGA